MTVDIAGLRTLADGFAFTECPRWRDGRLFFSDMRGGTVHRLDEAGVVEIVVRIDGRPGGLGFAPDGDLLIAAMDWAQVLRLRGGTVAVHADLSALAPGGINDMVVDRHGRCHVARFPPRFPAPEQPLILIDADGTVRDGAAPLKVANGMVLTPDERTLVVAESAGGRLSAFDLDDNGVPGPRRTFATLPDGHFPDGIGRDGAGGIWVACCRGPGVVRVEEGGAVTHRVPVGGDRFAYACTLGGADGRTLFVCTATAGAHDAADGRRDARIETVRVPVAADAR